MDMFVHILSSRLNMKNIEVVTLIRLYIGKSDGWVVGVDTLIDILNDIENGYSFNEIIDHYNLL